MGLIRVGLDPSQGHCWPPTIVDPNNAGTKTILVEGFPVALVGDPYLTHPGPCGSSPPHAAIALGSGGTVFMEGKLVHLSGDPLSCGDTAGNSGIPSVTVG